MNVKTAVPLVLAIVLGLFAAIAAKNMIDKNKSGPKETTHYTQVVVAKDNIPAGTALSATDVTVGRMAGDIPSSVVYGTPDELIGRVLVCSLIKGQPIMDNVLAPKGTGSGLQALVPIGMRAITIEVNDFSGVGGFLVPGCHVDVIATLVNASNTQFTRTVVQNLKVTAVNSHMTAPAPGADPEQMRSVTLLATPKEAEAVNLAAASGHPRFVLRASGDNTTTNTSGVTLAELAGKQTDPFADLLKAMAPKPATQPNTTAASWKATHTREIQTIRGGVEGDTTVQVGNQPVQKPQLMTDTTSDTKSAIPNQ
jgi:pilus assembly protein CpaB